MTRISISICPTALQYDNGDTYDSDKLLDAIRLFALTRHPDATITTLQIGHRQGDEWAKVDGDEEAGADLLAAFFDAHGTDDDLFASRVPERVTASLEERAEEGTGWYAYVNGQDAGGPFETEADALEPFMAARGSDDAADDNAPKIIKQTGGSVTVGDEYTYDYITRDSSGRLRLFTQDCTVNEDGYVQADDDPLDLTNSVDSETLAEWAGYWTLDTVHGDPADCMVAPGETLVGHRLMRRS